jgi:hypothetical protein
MCVFSNPPPDLAGTAVTYPTAGNHKLWSSFAVPASATLTMASENTFSWTCGEFNGTAQRDGPSFSSFCNVGLIALQEPNILGIGI